MERSTIKCNASQASEYSRHQRLIPSNPLLTPARISKPELATEVQFSVEQLVREAEKKARAYEKRVQGFGERVDGVAERARELKKRGDEDEKIEKMEERGRILIEEEEKLRAIEDRVLMESWEENMEMEEMEEKEGKIAAEVTKKVEDMTFEEEVDEKRRQIAELLESMDRGEAKWKLDHLPVALNELDSATRKVIQEFKNKLKAYDMRARVESEGEEQSDEEWDELSQDESDGEGWEKVKA
jgi:hypothetical protein